MEHQVTANIAHMTVSHKEMAKILQIKRDIVVHMSAIITAIPDNQLTFSGVEAITKNSMQITENITNYLNGIAELEEAIAENLTQVMKELSGTEEEE